MDDPVCIAFKTKYFSFPNENFNSLNIIFERCNFKMKNVKKGTFVKIVKNHCSRL